MFEKTLQDQLKRIFGLSKVTYDIPGQSQEQEGVFIEVSTCRPRIKDARQIARVEGKVHVFASLEKLPYGFFAKRLDLAEPEDVRGLSFYNFEENKGTFRNIVERSLQFVYLFDSQYDPAIGTITEVDFSYAES